MANERQSNAIVSKLTFFFVWWRRGKKWWRRMEGKKKTGNTRREAPSFICIYALIQAIILLGSFSNVFCVDLTVLFFLESHFSLFARWILSTNFKTNFSHLTFDRQQNHFEFSTIVFCHLRIENLSIDWKLDRRQIFLFSIWNEEEKLHLTIMSKQLTALGIRCRKSEQMREKIFKFRISFHNSVSFNRRKVSRQRIGQRIFVFLCCRCRRCIVTTRTCSENNRSKRVCCVVCEWR